MSQNSHELKPPAPRLLLRESRAVLDFAKMLAPLARGTLRNRTQADFPLIIVVPGFGSGDRYTLPLRRHLKSLGYDAEGWGLGTNLGGLNLRHDQDDLSDRWKFDPLTEYRGELGVPYLTDRFIDRVLERHEQTGKNIILIGWSLGGVLAREAARELPDIIERLITMGSPTIGGPKYTAAASAFSRRGTDIDWIEARIRERESTPIKQPITAIVSRSDGVVSYNAARDYFSPNVEHIDIDAAHLGMGFNPTIWRLIRKILRSHQD